MTPASPLTFSDELRRETLAPARPFGSPLLARAEQSTPTGLRIEIARDDDAVQHLLPHWDGLLERNATRTPFMRRDWIDLWWKHFAKDHQALIGSAWTTKGELIALAPFAIGPGTAPARRHLRHLSFFGGIGEVVAEGLDLMAIPGCEPVLDTLLDKTLMAARGNWDTAHFGFVDLASPHLERLRRALGRHASEVNLVNEQPSPIIRFDDGGWDAYIMQRSGSFRKKYRNLVTDSEKAFRVTVREARDTAEAAELLDVLLKLHGDRWTPDQSLFLQPRTRAFHNELASQWCPIQRAALLVIDFDNRPVAANYAFVEGDKIWDYQGGWSVADIAYSPGKLIMAENIRWAMRQGLKEYDLLPGDVEYKNKWAKEHRLVADLEAVNPSSLRARVFHSMRSVKRALTHLLPRPS